MSKGQPSLDADPRLAAVLSSIGDAYFVLDRKWRFVALNKPVEGFFGLEREQILGRTLWELYRPGDASPFVKILRRAMDDGEPGHLRAASLVHKGRVFDMRATPLQRDGIGVAAVDMTERARAEEALRESQERLDLAVGAHNIGIFDWRVPSGRILWSPQLEAIFGLEPGAFEGTAEAFRARVLPEDLEPAQAATEAALREGRDLIPFKFRIRRPDGEIRWIEGMSRVVYAPDGSPLRIVGTNFDITERVLAEQEVRASRERLDLAVGAHNIGIFDWDLRTGGAVWSREMEAIFGLPPGGFEGHVDDFRRRVEPGDLERSQAEMDEAVSEGRGVVEFDYRIRRPDGSIRWLEGVARIVYGPDGEPERMVGTNIDVTERKQAELHQRLMVNELNHRVKNTLAIVQAMAWQSLRSGGVAKPAREAFEGRLSALAAAHDVLTRQSWESGSIADMVSGAVAPHDPGGERLTFGGPHIELEPKTAVALALAIHELATNAVKHGALSTPTGRVEVRWTIEDGRLRLVWRETGGPKVMSPIQRGFGARLLEQGLAEELRGVVRLEFRPEGVLCEVEAGLAA